MKASIGYEELIEKAALENADIQEGGSHQERQLLCNLENPECKSASDKLNLSGLV